MSALVNHGLNNPARDLVETVATAREAVDRKYPCGGSCSFNREVEVAVFAVERMVQITVDGGHQVGLQAYKAPDGTCYEEFVQACRTGCDVHVFLALKIKDGAPVPASLWQEWEMSVGGACYCRHTC